MDIVGTEANNPQNPPAENPETTSVLDHEVFATKHMPDLGYDMKEFRVFHWALQGWGGLERKLTSPEFDCGGHTWRILLFPVGNSNAPPSDTLSVYFDHVSPSLGGGRHVCAQFALVISNPHDPTIYTVSHAHHRFTPDECDWGFTRFSELRTLLQPQPGHNRPTIEGGSTVISVYVRVLEDPTGVLWHNFVNYDSKKDTGYVGLKNQGATDYMNTVLQCLFCINYFRKVVYQIPTEDQQPTESTPLALQRVFYNLQTSDQSVRTTELMKTFGWKSSDPFVRRDVEEFNRELQDKLESVTKGTHVEGTIRELFVGKAKTFVKCVNVDYESSRIEEFKDIQLNVKGIKTLYDSFRDYVAVETLDGESKYQAEGLGLQDARKGLIFQSLPPVLHLQLKRYEYDVQRGAMAKVNDRFEFPFEIDLDEFLDETADRTQPWKYKLHGVVVHSGNTHSGLYFALIKPDRDTRWLKFDDDQVSPVTDREVLEDNYGGESPNGVAPQGPMDRARAPGGLANARMLVYIRETAIDEVLAPLAPEDTPPYIKRRLDEERAQAEKERNEQHLFLTAKVVTDETFSRHEGFDLAVFSKGSLPPSNLPTFRVLKEETYSVFKSRVAQRFGYPESRIRLWMLVSRQNKTVRPDTVIPENEPLLTVEVVRNDMAQRSGDLLLYLDILPGPFERVWSGNGGTVMIFLKHFDTTRQSLFGIGKIYVPRVCKVRHLIPSINAKMRWAPGTPLKLYEELKPGIIELMNLGFTIPQSEIQDGDIICFQVAISNEEAHDLESRGLHSNPQQFYKFLQSRMVEADKRREPLRSVNTANA